MKKLKLSRIAKISLKIVAIILAIPAVLIAVVAISFLYGKVTQVKQAEADKVCREFFDQVKSDITSVPGYTVINENKRCSPSKDEAGFTDYYFDATFKVAKTGNDSVDGMKANINYLSDKLPGKKYPVWIRNQAGKNGQPQTICVNASKQIQENGDEYQATAPGHYPEYLEPSEFTGGFTGSCADL